MSDSDVLSKAEVGALLTGVADGVIKTNSGVKPSGDVSAFEYKSNCHVSSYCPAALVTLYTRTTRRLQTALYTMLRKDISVTLSEIRRHRYDEYFASMKAPICLYTLKESRLPGTALIIFDASLVYGFVDNYFGGEGDPTEIEERDITPAEARMSRRLLEQLLSIMADTWSDVLTLDFSVRKFETDPSMVTVAASTESMLVVRITIAIGGTPHDCHVAMPLAMIEPIRPRLEASNQGGLLERARFRRGMQQAIKDARVALSGTLCELPMTLRDLLALSPGDIIPIDLPSTIELDVDDAPVLYGRFGRSRGMDAVSVYGRVTDRKSNLSSSEANS
ncbi:MAG: FliM/FliN family flagellar motor switch protein [Pseudomonadota bacterium]